MATNERFRDADHLTLPVPSGTVSGDPVRVGALNGVAQTSRDEDGNATVWLKGAYDLEVDGAVTDVGSPLYLDGKTLVVAAGELGEPFGYALATKTAAAAPVPVRIAQV
jgi:predicted RecA/RadA family phage recombinase